MHIQFIRNAPTSQRNSVIYYEYAKKHHAKIVGIIENYPHLKIHQQLGVSIYASSLTKASYPRMVFGEGLINNAVLGSLYTPSHAPDHISGALPAHTQWSSGVGMAAHSM